MSRCNKYIELTNYLVKCNLDDVNLTFEEIEKILGFKLPNGAKKINAFWSNSPSHPIYFGFHNAGYYSHDVNLNNNAICFSKIKFNSGEQKLDNNYDKKIEINILEQLKEIKKYLGDDVEIYEEYESENDCAIYLTGNTKYNDELPALVYDKKTGEFWLHNRAGFEPKGEKYKKIYTIALPSKELKLEVHFGSEFQEGIDYMTAKVSGELYNVIKVKYKEDGIDRLNDFLDYELEFKIKKELVKLLNKLETEEIECQYDNADNFDPDLGIPYEFEDYTFEFIIEVPDEWIEE